MFNADIIFCCLWVLLNIGGVTVQIILHLVQKRRYRKRQIRKLRGADPLISVGRLGKYPGFPSRSLYRQLVNRLTKKGQYVQPLSMAVGRVNRSRVANARTADDSSRPLLSPDSSLNAHGNTRYYGTYNIIEQ